MSKTSKQINEALLMVMEQHQKQVEHIMALETFIKDLYNQEIEIKEQEIKSKEYFGRWHEEGILLMVNKLRGKFSL